MVTMANSTLTRILEGWGSSLVCPMVAVESDSCFILCRGRSCPSSHPPPHPLLFLFVFLQFCIILTWEIQTLKQLQFTSLWAVPFLEYGHANCSLFLCLFRLAIHYDEPLLNMYWFSVLMMMAIQCSALKSSVVLDGLYIYIVHRYG